MASTRAATAKTNDRRRMMEAMLTRSSNALRRLVESASSDELATALAAPTDVGGIALLISEVGSLQPEYLELDPLAAALARGAIAKQKLLAEAGGAYTTSQVAEMLGISRQGVQQRVRRGTLLALSTGAGEQYYPACQFGETGVVPGLERVLAAFNVEGDWTKLSVLLSTDDAVEGRRLIDALKDGEVEEVRRIVGSYAQ